MSNEATSHVLREHTIQQDVYETIETTCELVAMAQYLTTARVEQVALVAITIYFDSDEKTTGSRPLYPDATTSTLYLLDSLRTLVRKTDVVFLHDSTLYFLLLGANLQGGQIVESRLWDALLWRIHNPIDAEVLRPHSIVIGHSAYPSPSNTIEAFIEAANNVSQSSTILSERPLRKTAVRSPQQTQPNEEGEFPALARKLGIPYLSLLPRQRPIKVQQLVNPQLAQELHCYPVGRERNILTVAMLNPQDHSALERLQQATGLHIYPVLTHPLELQTALEQLI
jgi:Type II secretion system (T2SS), protein E, N-terminal domain